MLFKKNTKEFIKKGNTYLAVGDCERAIDCFDKALSVEPSNIEALNLMKNAKEELKSKNEAKTKPVKLGAIDITKGSVGLQSLRGLFKVLIPINSVFPIENSQIVTTIKDSQESIITHPGFGNYEKMRGNQSFGMWEINGIPVTTKEIPRIEIKLRLEITGELYLSAKEILEKKNLSISRLR